MGNCVERTGSIFGLGRGYLKDTSIDDQVTYNIAPAYFYKLKASMEGDKVHPIKDWTQTGNYTENVTASIDEAKFSVTIKVNDAKKNEKDLKDAEQDVDKQLQECPKVTDAKAPWWNYKMNNEDREFDWENHFALEKAYQEYTKAKKDAATPVQVTVGKQKYKVSFTEQDEGQAKLHHDKKGVSSLEAVRKVEGFQKIADKFPSDVQ